jgi:hypothetical protein
VSAHPNRACSAYIVCQLLRSIVWLPIALTYRICHGAPYREAYRTLQYHYILANTPIPRTMTPDSSSHHPINTDGLLTAYMHLCYDAGYRDACKTPQCYYIFAMTPLSLETPCQCMVAHCSDIQDLSGHTIPRRLQDTALPLHLAITPLSLDSSHRTHQYQYRWPRYCIYAPIP